jgi:hypothetical protein
MVYCTRMTGYLEKAQGKALFHKVRAQPYYQSAKNEILWRYDVECKGKMRLDPSCERTQQVCELGNQRCSCRKMQLLHPQLICEHRML